MYNLYKALKSRYNSAVKMGANNPSPEAVFDRMHGQTLRDDADRLFKASKTSKNCSDLTSLYNNRVKPYESLARSKGFDPTYTVEYVKKLVNRCNNRNW